MGLNEQRKVGQDMKDVECLSVDDFKERIGPQSECKNLSSYVGSLTQEGICWPAQKHSCINSL